jgi:hypothetical protein
LARFAVNDSSDYEHIDTLIRHRCGDAIADAMLPAEIFIAVMDVLDAIEEELADLTARAEGLLEP